MGKINKFLPLVVASVLSLALLPLVVDDAYAGNGDIIPPPGGSDFASPFLGDFKCYDITDEPIVRVSIGLDDQFEDVSLDIFGAIKVCTNVFKAESIDPPYRESPLPSIRQDPTVRDQHFTVYQLCKPGATSTICDPPEFDPRFVRLVDQFGTTDHEVITPIELWVPAAKDVDGGFPMDPPDFEQRHNIHYKCYEIEPKANESPFDIPFLVSLTDQFGPTQHNILEATKFCNPVIKTFQFPVGNLDVEHLKCYRFANPISNTVVAVDFLDQFGFHEQFEILQDEELCVSADKLPIPVIGGSNVPINTSALLLAGVQSISMWLIPVVIAGVGIGVFVIKRRK